jgi:hypothetical protein
MVIVWEVLGAGPGCSRGECSLPEMFFGLLIDLLLNLWLLVDLLFNLDLPPISPKIVLFPVVDLRIFVDPPFDRAPQLLRASHLSISWALVFGPGFA